MKLRYGKGSWLELEHMPIESHVANGIRTFAAAPSRAAKPRVLVERTRAAAVANRATIQAFEKWTPDLAPRSLRAAVAPEKVQTAVFRDGTGAMRVVYREVVIRFEPLASQAKRRALLKKWGLEVRNRNTYHHDQIIAVDPKRKYIAERMIELANELTETDEVLFAFPNFVSEFKRAAVAPTFHPEQWHLGTVSARRAWDRAQGAGIVVAVLDDGVDVEHPNLAASIRRKPDRTEPRDLCGRDFFVAEDAPDHFDPRPKRFRAPFAQMTGNDIHGTPCAGVIASTGSKGGVRGVAPKARILPVKIFHADDLATESRVANAIRYASRFADILSCSWSGPISPDIELALEEAAAGRDGKGCPIFFATGNENTKVGFPARSRFVIAVGASTEKERRASYSNHGPQVSVTAPSNELDGSRGIFTTDVSLANRGFNVGDDAAGGADGLHTNSFGGTSSATPLVAGIAALMLSANPALTRDEVRTILQDTADKIGARRSYNVNGHSNDFGFGRVNAARAVAQAIKLAGKKKPAKKTARRRPAKARRPAATRKPRRRTAARKRAA